VRQPSPPLSERLRVLTQPECRARDGRALLRQDGKELRNSNCRNSTIALTRAAFSSIFCCQR
jgi:hypothetical protein